MIDAIMAWVAQYPSIAQAIMVGVIVLVFSIIAMLWAAHDKPIDPWDHPDDYGA